MSANPTREQIWQEIDNQIFAVLGMVTAANESRTVGVVIATHQQKLYIGTGRQAWKTRHIQNNPHVSVTVPVHKSIPLMPWIKIPAATISFSGTAVILSRDESPPDAWQAVFRGTDESDSTMLTDMCLIEITPTGHFLTYGIGVKLMDMRVPEKARARVPVNPT